VFYSRGESWTSQREDLACSLLSFLRACWGVNSSLKERAS
jgi:hypothetical protein